jgi:hypothetical protein
MTIEEVSLSISHKNMFVKKVVESKSMYESWIVKEKILFFLIEVNHLNSVHWFDNNGKCSRCG